MPSEEKSHKHHKSLIKEVDVAKLIGKNLEDDFASATAKFSSCQAEKKSCKKEQLQKCSSLNSISKHNKIDVRNKPLINCKKTNVIQDKDTRNEGKQAIKPHPQLESISNKKVK